MLGSAPKPGGKARGAYGSGARRTGVFWHNFHLPAQEFGQFSPVSLLHVIVDQT